MSALAPIEAWFLANEAALAPASRHGMKPAQELLAGLEAVLRTVGQDADGSASDKDSHNRTPGGFDEATDVLLGSAVGACFAHAPNVTSLEAAASVVRTTAGWDAFSDTVATAVADCPAGSAALETFLDGLVHAFTWAPRMVVHTHRDNMCALVEHFRRQPRLDDVWPGGLSRIMLMRHEPAFDALRLGAPSAFLRLLDRFPHPEPGRHILAYSSRRLTLSQLLGLLDMAQPCFEAGVWLPWIKSPVLVLAAIEEKLAAQPSEEGADGLKPSMDFAAAAAMAVDAVLKRPDGNELGHAWLQRMMHPRAFRWRLGSANDDDRLRQRHLMFELASALSPRRDVREWVLAEREPWRRDRAVAAIAGAGLGNVGDPAATALLLLGVLGLRLGATGQDRGFSASADPERWLVGALIGRHADPAAWFGELWSALAPFRDKARHATASAVDRPEEATLIAVTWFLFGLDAIDVQAPAHRALWRSLLGAVQEGALAQPSPIMQPAWTRRQRLLAAHLANRLMIAGDQDGHEDLRDLLEPLLCLEMTLAEVLAILFDAGIPPGRILKAVADKHRLIELLRRLGVEQAWRETRQQEEIHRQSRFSLKIAQMADAMEQAVG